MQFKICGYLRFLMTLMACLAILGLVSCGTGDKEAGSMGKGKLIPDKIAGYEREGELETYDRETIFDYINGAGEVYLSYGFQLVTVARFEKAEAPEISVEVFDMASDADAYGVFSHSRESEQEGIGQGYEFGGSLLCFWKSHYFVCVKSMRGTPESREAIEAVARAVDKNIESTGQKPDLLSYLPQENLKTESVRYFHTHPSLNYHYFLAEDNILNLDENTRAVLARYATGDLYLLCIEYADAEAAEAAGESFIENYLPEAAGTGGARTESGQWTAIDTKGRFVVISLDADSEDEAHNLVERCLEKIK